MKDDSGNGIGVSVGLTKNLGNYESMRIDAWAKKELVYGEDRDQAWADLWAEVQAQLEAQVSEADEALSSVKKSK